MLLKLVSLVQCCTYHHSSSSATETPPFNKCQFSTQIPSFHYYYSIVDSFIGFHMVYGNVIIKNLTWFGSSLVFMKNTCQLKHEKGYTVSIHNRYQHSFGKCDFTFSNNCIVNIKIQCGYEIKKKCGRCNNNFTSKFIVGWSEKRVSK